MTSPLRIGILEADHVGPRYRHIAGGYGDMFAAMVTAVDPSAEVVVYDAVHGPLPDGPAACDGWLCTGAAASVYDDEPWIHALSDFVRDIHDAQAPTVGICFGHQLLAHALGGRTERAAGGWGVGALPMRVLVSADWMQPSLPEATLLYSHQDQVVQLPPGATVVASARHCPIAMYTVDDHLLGIQAHPEFGTAYLRALLVDRVDPIGEAETATALASLERPTQERIVAGWILGFLRGRTQRQG